MRNYSDKLMRRAMSDTRSGCLVWQGGKTSGGYGKHTVDQRTVLAHRFAWELANGPIPAGLLVCHACDNRACINVQHMFLGTHADNSADMKAKGRQARGTKCHTNVLTEDQVRGVRAALNEGVSQSKLAKQFDTAIGTIWNIAHGHSWKHLN